MRLLTTRHEALRTDSCTPLSKPAQPISTQDGDYIIHLTYYVNESLLHHTDRLAEPGQSCAESIYSKGFEFDLVYTSKTPGGCC
ncbi:hypothetical protein OEZ85_000319 [Tetradesmus obliquus]|uniref:Uncharacterized protein n=1 Tax=Tetradesmus obliquus TaxID=3088 RepID=A0ABY8UQU1_TETOB|nr:hypothetical protein OEZ85_000319 [Tetradesmus obliquus]